LDKLKHIYSHQAAEYHNLIKFEDVDCNLLPTINRISPLKGKRLLDLGTGTGRIPLLVHQLTSNIVGLDLHWDMLREHKVQKELKGEVWELAQADMRNLPIRSANFDIITAGWSISAFRVWEDKHWENHIGQVINEMHRTIKPGGVLIIIETMTTASTAPAPPTQELAEYYSWLENEWGFTREVVQTDYQFDNLDQAVTMIDFFFGQETADTVRENNWVRVPEWTGIWNKIISV
jgi:ubiquinone/menaquinone biosynthesis C-methylase UbiE